MYSKRIIQQKLDKYEKALGWAPYYHTIDQVREFKEYVAKVTTIESNSRNSYVRITKRLSTDKQRTLRMWIQNEQILCSIDAHYWLTRYAFICDEKGDIFQFKTRVSQEIFFQLVAHFEDLEVAIEIFILKARQVGISTMTALLFLHRMMYIPNTQAVMASVQQEKSELIGRILQICYQRCPWWAVPRQTVDRIGKMGFANDSILSIQSGMQATGIAQGWTPTAIHVSELADIPNPKKTIEEGLLRATHSSRKLFQVFEGTGGGSTGWQADFWRSSKEGFPRGESRFCPLFIPWALATDLYPEADWIKKFPIPSDWTPVKETRKHVMRMELYIRNTPFLADVAGKDWTMPREQQWFWEFNYREAVKKHTERTWASQMPADDNEALTGKNDIIFAPEVIEIQRSVRQRKYQCYAVIGKSIDDGFEPDPNEVDYEQERIEIHWTSHREEEYDWILVPLLPLTPEQEREETASLDRLYVFEPPKAGRDYSIGIDTADGLNKPDEDRTIINVTLSAKGNFPDVQVAELASLRINSPQAVGFAAALGAWYGEKCRDERGAKFCIEQRERPGDDCQHQLKMMGFLFHHEMIRYDDKKVKETNSNKQGWYSNAWSRPFIMNRFVDAVNNGWYKANSQWLIQELENLERKITAAGKTKIEHQSGKHDDRVLAAALAYITRHHMDVLAERSEKKYQLRRGNLPTFNAEYANIAAMSVGD